MNTKNLILSVFVLLTILFASLTFAEHIRVGTVTVTKTIYTKTTSTSTSTTCTIPPLVGCGPYAEPILLNASVSQSSAMTFCSLATQGYPQAAVCDVTISEGVSGTVVLNLTSQVEDTYVAFGTYSSESRYVQFASSYPCLYSSGSLDYNTDRCPISIDGSTYRLNYTVSPSLPAPEEAVLTIVVTMTCCFP
jgi:hypothetical protein